MTEATRSIVIVGGGFSGALFGLKLHRVRPDWRIVVVEPRKKLGRGIAYGACGPNHLLNVPASRMEIGLSPSFMEWLEPRRNEIAEALVESGPRSGLVLCAAPAVSATIWKSGSARRWR
ncbi:MAG: FAD/NAD(P)-binding protein [Aliidongia sp.]